MTPLSSQNVVIHHGQTQEYVLKPTYFTAQKVISGEQSTEGSLPLRFGQDHVAAPFQCEYVLWVISLSYRVTVWKPFALCRWL